MLEKHYKCGLYLGRFQPFHIGHVSIINQMLCECDTIAIAIGSAQESGTERNPLSFLFRSILIQETCLDYLDRIKFYAIYDRETYSDDSTWGQYVLNVLNDQYNVIPDIIYKGDDKVNTVWYKDCNIPVVTVSRNSIPISGTELRKTILEGHKDYALDYLPEQTHKFYDKIREEILNACNNKRPDQLD